MLSDLILSIILVTPICHRAKMQKTIALFILTQQSIKVKSCSCKINKIFSGHISPLVYDTTLLTRSKEENVKNTNFVEF